MYMMEGKDRKRLKESEENKSRCVKVESLNPEIRD